MSFRRVRAPRIDFASLRRELGLPTEFPLAARREAEEAAGSTPPPVTDHTDIPFVTIDPATSRDLDQAVCLGRRPGGGYRVWYAIADVAAYVQPGGPLETETWQRGQTVYLPDEKVPLHPRVLSEDAASLLPDQVRRAVLWTIDLDSDGATSAVRLERAMVRSRAKLNYVGVQADMDAGRLAEPIELLPEIGKLLLAQSLARGAIELPTLEQEVEPDGDGWRLTLRLPVPVEAYNAQISLLTGVAAARIMLAGGVGLLRTMPPARADALDRLRAAAAALEIAWPDGATVGAVIAGLDGALPRAAAFLGQVPEILRGAGYTAFDGEPPALREHAGVAAPYAHVTAPLRRLADRYATEVCRCLHDGVEVSAWARDALPKLPEVMSRTDRVAGTAERGAVELVEAALLADRVGEVFEAAVLDVDEPRSGPGARARPPGGTVAVDDPPVRARCEGERLPLGGRIRVRLMEADPGRRRVLFRAE